jgi:5-methyltetrahydrofolate--homocysteine methyltransferase
MSDLTSLAEAVIKGDIAGAMEETQKVLEAGADVQEILDKGLAGAMDEVGERFAKGLMFVPQMLRSAKTMHECIELIKPFFQEDAVTHKGKMVIGSVKGDLHDIGKNLVAMMMEGAGFTISDVGVDVSPEEFVHKVQELQPDIVGMSALLSTTMPAMLQTIEALEKAGIRQNVKVIIGGAPVTAKYAQEIKADAYASDAGSAIMEAKRLLGIS